MTKCSAVGKDRIAELYPHVNEEDMPLPRSWSPQDRCTHIGLSQNSLRAHYKGTRTSIWHASKVFTISYFWFHNIFALALLAIKEIKSYHMVVANPLSTKWRTRVILKLKIWSVAYHLHIISFEIREDLWVSFSFVPACFTHPMSFMSDGRTDYLVEWVFFFQSLHKFKPGSKYLLHVKVDFVE